MENKMYTCVFPRGENAAQHNVQVDTHMYGMSELGT